MLACIIVDLRSLVLQDTHKQEILALRVRAMNILAAREHSVAELRDKLRTKMHKQASYKQHRHKCSQNADDQDMESTEPDPAEAEQIDEQIEQLLAQLIDENLLNDERFTESFIRSRMARGQGPVKIRHELQKRSVASELIDDYLDESWELWQETLENVRQKKFGAELPKDYKEQTKQSRFLYQRGFGSEMIRRLFNEF